MATRPRPVRTGSFGCFWIHWRRPGRVWVHCGGFDSRRLIPLTVWPYVGAWSVIVSETITQVFDGFPGLLVYH